MKTDGITLIRLLKTIAKTKSWRHKRSIQACVQTFTRFIVSWLFVYIGSSNLMMKGIWWFIQHPFMTKIIKSKHSLSWKKPKSTFVKNHNKLAKIQVRVVKNTQRIKENHSLTLFQGTSPISKVNKHKHLYIPIQHTRQ